MGQRSQRGRDAPTTLEEAVVPISRLIFGQSPRHVAEDIDHARMLAEVIGLLPPILVHAETMEVIDGRHRVLAARLRGDTSIRARLFHGTTDEAYFVGVHENTAHGKPLNPAERRMAASRILKSRPDLSDRVVARICGLSHRTIAARRKSDPTSNVAKRVGADGRARPLSSSDARQRAAELIIAFPEHSNRSIARSVGLSEGTVRDVRRHMGRLAEASRESRIEQMASLSDPPARPDESQLPEKGTVDDGALFARWMMAHSISQASWTDLLDDIPVFQRPQVIGEALRISDSWRDLAKQLEGRDRGETT